MAIYESWTFWVLLGFLLTYVFSRFPLVKELISTLGGKKKTLFIFLGIALLVSGVFADFMGVAGSASELPTVTTEATSVKSVSLSAGLLNGSGSSPVTTADYYNSDDTVMTLYVNDALLNDDEYVNATLKIVRQSSTYAGSIEVICTSSDFSKSGTMYNMVSKDSSDELEMVINGETDCSETSCSGMVDFAEGTSSSSIGIAYKHDEAAEDQLTVKEEKSLSCVAGGKAVEIVFVAND